MLQTHPCVTARCDQCGQDGSGHWDYQPHWPTEAAALADLADAGWQLTGSRLLCARCAALLACRTHGHEFSPWRACLCAQSVQAHPVHPDGSCGSQYRTCGRCDAGEERPSSQRPSGEVA